MFETIVAVAPLTIGVAIGLSFMFRGLSMMEPSSSPRPYVMGGHVPKIVDNSPPPRPPARAPTKVAETRLLGHEKTEHLIASWLEAQWSPLGDDLTDIHNSRQIADMIRKGIYLGDKIDEAI